MSCTLLGVCKSSGVFSRSLLDFQLFECYSDLIQNFLNKNKVVCMCARGHVCKCHGVHVEVKEHPRGARTLLLPCEYWPLDSGGQLSSKFLLPLSNRAGPSFFSVILLMSRYTVLCYRLKSLREDSMCSMTGPAHVPSPVPSSTVTSQRQKNGDIGHQQTGTVCLSPAHVTWEPRHLPCSALVWEQWFCGPELCQLLWCQD